MITDNLVFKRQGYCQSFEAVAAGNYRLSIQGSSAHYCTPKSEGPCHRYTSMELAIFPKGKGGFLHFKKSSVMRTFPRYDELVDRMDGKGGTVFGYVPVDLIDELYNYLKNK